MCFWSYKLRKYKNKKTKKQTLINLFFEVTDNFIKLFSIFMNIENRYYKKVKYKACSSLYLTNYDYPE